MSIQSSGMRPPSAPEGYEGLAQAVRQLLNIELSGQQFQAFRRYASELVEWNARFNLTAITEPEEIEIKHFLDSLSCLVVPELRPPANIVDVGTGAGFPGLPLKIAFPQFRLTLVESVGKKAEFCRHMVGVLGLEGVQVIHARAETLGRDPLHRGRYDWALARAVATAPVVLEYTLPLIKLRGRALLQKGPTGPAEIQTAEHALAVLGGKVRRMVPIELPHVAETRYLIVVEKTAATPDTYPRRPGIPAKRPLVG